jgi:UDP-N-acetylmuramoyl-tripeptide--D-alanyl-D-alanine ligase
MEIARSSAMKFLSYNYDNEILRAAVSGVRPKIRLVGVGTTGGGVRISNIAQRVSPGGTPELSLEISRGERTFLCHAGIYGRQNARNIAFAYAIASELGLSDETFADALKSASLPQGRGGVEPLSGRGVLIDDTYNANPDSVSHALRNLIDLELPEGSRRIAVLGGMRELGANSKHWHEVVMSRAGLLDEIHLIGEEWSGVETRQASLAGKWRDADDFIANFDFSKTAGSVILVKGSRYYALERLLPHFGVAKGEGRA